MASKQHNDYTNYILSRVREVNPYHDKDAGQMYALALLASYLANYLENDPYLYKQFTRHMDNLKK